MLKYKSLYDAVIYKDINAVKEFLNMFKLQKMNKDNKIYLLLENTFLCNNDYNIWKFIFLFIYEDININFKNNICDGSTALMMASRKGHTKIVKMLIYANAKLNLKNKDGMTALMWASWQGHTNIVKMLIDVKAKLNLQSKEGSTALMLANNMRNIYIANILVDAGAVDLFRNKKKNDELNKLKNMLEEKEKIISRQNKKISRQNKKINKLEKRLFKIKNILSD